MRKKVLIDMDQITLSFKVNDQDLLKTGGMKRIASHTVNYIQTKFDLGHNWNDFDEIQAVWSYGSTIIGTPLDEEGVCHVPDELLTKTGKISVNLQGTIVKDGKLKARLTTFPIIAIEITAKAEVGSDA